MAQWYTSKEQIQKDLEAKNQFDCTHLMEQLNYMSKEFTIFYKPYFPDFQVDFVLLHEKAGILLLDICPSPLSQVVHYRTHPDTQKKIDCFSYDDNPQVMFDSPMASLRYNKDVLYEDYFQTLYMEKLQNHKAYGVVRTAVYFPHDTESTIENILGEVSRNYNELRYDPSFTNLWGGDTKFSWLLRNNYKIQHECFSKLLWEQAYALFSDYKLLEVTQGMLVATSVPKCKIVTLDKKQLSLSQSEEGKQQKVRGVAGCGKTTVLASRAINAYERTEKPVLILTYNITIANYIKSKIRSIYPNYHDKQFLVMNIHHFIYKRLLPQIKLQTSGEIINSGVQSEEEKFNNLLNLLGDVISKTQDMSVQFDTILIDEIQDFERVWFDFIKTHILRKNGEYVLFGDEKQNIYDRDQEEKKVITNVVGGWNELKTSYRCSTAITSMAIRFQREFMGLTYDMDELEEATFESLASSVRYYKWGATSPEARNKKILDLMAQLSRDEDIPFGDMALIGGTISNLQSFEDFATSQNVPCITTFETNEQRRIVEEKTAVAVERTCDKLRRDKKKQFFTDSNKLKISTVHSFKGWEIPTLFLVVTEEHMTHELLYTAFTRCQQHLVILDSSESGYSEFFREYTVN